MPATPTPEAPKSAAPQTAAAHAEKATLLARWLGGALGRSLLAAEAELLAGALDDVFGLELLQLGSWGGGRELLSACRTRRQTIVADFAASGPGQSAPDLLGRLAALPVRSDSVDAVLLPHTLEFEPDAQAIVREADRVLTGEGQLIVLGFRPWSLWGLRSAASRTGYPPGLKRLLPERRLRDWLVLLGYEIVSTQHYLFSRPWSRGAANDAGRRMLRRGLLNPLPPAAYLLKARKRIYTLTPVRQRFRERASVFGGLVKPTTRSQG